MFHAIHSKAQLKQQTIKQKIVDYLDQLIKAAAPAAVYRDRTVKPFEKSYEPWNEVRQQMLQYAEH